MRINKIGILGLITTLLLVFNVTKVEAAKKFVPKKSTGGYVRTSESIPVSVHYRPDKLAILFSFPSFSGIDSVNYSFTYSANGNPQGAGGTVRAGNNPSAERELLFGTCSTSVCTYHSGLSGARLVFTATMTNGHTITKSFRIKTYR